MTIILKRNIDEKFRELIEWDTFITVQNIWMECNINGSSLARKKNCNYITFTKDWNIRNWNKITSINTDISKNEIYHK